MKDKTVRKFKVILNVTEYHDCIIAETPLESFNKAQENVCQSRSITMNSVIEINEDQ